MFDVAGEAEVRYVPTWTTKRILALMTVTMIVVVEIPKVDDEMVCLLDSSAAACCDLHRPDGSRCNMDHHSSSLVAAVVVDDDSC